MQLRVRLSEVSEELAKCLFWEAVESIRQPVMKVESYSEEYLSRVDKWNRTTDLRFTKILR